MKSVQYQRCILLGVQAVNDHYSYFLSSLPGLEEAEFAACRFQLSHVLQAQRRDQETVSSCEMHCQISRNKNISAAPSKWPKGAAGPWLSLSLSLLPRQCARRARRNTFKNAGRKPPPI